MNKANVPDWLARLTKRPDIQLYSLFPSNVSSVEKNTVKFDNLVASIVCIDAIDNKNTMLGWPKGEIWDAVSKIDYMDWRLIETPTDLQASHELRLRYRTLTTEKVSKFTRSGKRHEFVEREVICEMLFPICQSALNHLSSEQTLHIVQYNKEHTLTDHGSTPILIPSAITNSPLPGSN